MQNTTSTLEKSRWRPLVPTDLAVAVAVAAGPENISRAQWLNLAIMNALLIRGHLPEGRELGELERQVVGQTKCLQCAGDHESPHRCTECQATFRIRALRRSGSTP